MEGVKILMTLMGMEIGGAETYVLELCKVLVKRGLKVYVASNGGAYEPELSACGIVHYQVPLHNRRLSNIIAAYRSLRRIIKDNGIGLVHAHGRIPGFICGLLQKKLPFRFVTTAHGIYSTEFPLNILSNWGEKSLAVSADVFNYLVDSYRVPARNIRITVNGIDTEKFSPSVSFEDLGIANALRVVSVSRLDADSSTAARLLTEAAPAIRERFPNASFYIVGDGTDYAEIKKLADANGVTMIGKRTDVSKWFAMADVFVGSSRSALEAMSSGKPVVAIGNNGCLGLLTEETRKTAMESNFMYFGCPASTAGKMTEGVTSALALSAGEREASGMENRAFIKANYSLNRMAEDTLAVYRSVTDSPWPMPLGKKLNTRVVISGYYGYNNSGDDMLLQAIIENLTALRPNLDITVLSMLPKETREQYGVGAVYRFNFLAVFLRLRRAKMLITGGGSVIQDETSTQSLVYYLWLINTARMLKLKNMLYANGIGPVDKPGNIRRVRKALNRVDLITLRESESLEVLRGMGVTRPQTRVTADEVFALPPADGERARRFLAEIGITGKFLCVAIRSWKNNPPGIESKIAAFADSVAERYGYQILFAPMQPDNDIEISSKVISLMRSPAVLMPVGKSADRAGEWDWRMIRGAVAEASLLLAMRLHALIYAMEKGVPVIGLVYSTKIRKLMDAMGQKWYMPVEEADAEVLTGFAEEILADRERISGEIKEAGERERERALLNARLCVGLME